MTLRLHVSAFLTERNPDGCGEKHNKCLEHYRLAAEPSRLAHLKHVRSTTLVTGYTIYT